MALFVAVKFSQEEMPRTFDPGPLQDLRPQDFVVVPRGQTEDVAFVAGLEHKSSHQLKLRRDPYPRIVRRATPQEVEAWWLRKAEERRLISLAKDKVAEMRLEIKVTHVFIDARNDRAIFQFTSDQRIDFRSLIKDLTVLVGRKVELWQMGVRDEARFVDGFGVCGLQTCCSTWLKDFRPISIKMAKDQDISLPPVKLSGQCGRLLCCLSYEVDQYREMAREALPKGATVKWAEREGIIVDRNLIARTYLVSETGGGLVTVKAEELKDVEVRIPEQMKKFGKKLQAARPPESAPGEKTSAPREAEAKPAPAPPSQAPQQPRRPEGPRRPPAAAAPRPEAPAAKEPSQRPEGPRRDKRKPQLPGATGGPPPAQQPHSASPAPVPADADDDAEDDSPATSPGTGAPPAGRRKKKKKKRPEAKPPQADQGPTA